MLLCVNVYEEVNVNVKVPKGGDKKVFFNVLSVY